MKVLIETPKYSFKKYVQRKGGFFVDLCSPLPSLYNYGCILGTRAEDGLPRDVIVLGPKIEQGGIVDVEQVGLAYFIDKGQTDNKIVASPDGRFRFSDQMILRIFLSVYTLYKTLRYFFLSRRFQRCRFGGLRKKT